MIGPSLSAGEVVVGVGADVDTGVTSANRSACGVTKDSKPNSRSSVAEIP